MRYADSRRGINSIADTLATAAKNIDPSVLRANVHALTADGRAKITNSSGRTTVVTNLMAAGCSNAQVQQVRIVPFTPHLPLARVSPLTRSPSHPRR